MKKALAFIALGGFLCFISLPLVFLGLLGGTATALSSKPANKLAGQSAVPQSWVAIDQGAARRCSGMPWSLLGAIGYEESNSGRSNLPGVHSGDNSKGAEGPMQFEPATFAEYEVIGPGGKRPASPYDPIDAIYSAENMLCHNGANQGSGFQGAVFGYNHTQIYVHQVLLVNAALYQNPSLSEAIAGVLSFTASKLGDPYKWGAVGPSSYDCSGLTQSAFKSVGIAIPRTAQEQYERGPQIQSLTLAEPGDLIFFGKDKTAIEHVGIYVATTEMIEAPHTGSVVKLISLKILSPIAFTRPQLSSDNLKSKADSKFQ